MSIIKNFDYWSKSKDKFPLRLSTDLDMSKKIANWLWAIEKQTFENIENEWNKKFDIYSSDSQDYILLQLKPWVVNVEKYKTLMKTNDDIKEIFKPF